MSRTALLAGLLGLAWSVQAQPADPLAQARALAAAGDYAGARTRLEQRLAAAPDDAGARFWLARVLAWQGHPDQALPLYAVLLEREPDNVDYLLGLGQAQLWAGRPAEAVATLERAQRLAPRYAEIDRALGQARAALDAGGSRPAAAAQAGAPGVATTDAGSASPPAAPTAPSPRLDAGEPATTPSATGERRRSVAYSLRRERLDHGLADWRAQRLDVVATTPGRVGAYGALVAEQRFGRDDAGLELGAVLPLAAGWTLQPELGWVPGAEVLPRRYLDLRLQRAFADGWVGAASLRRSDYPGLHVGRLALGVERYAGPWRAGYTLNLTRLDGATAAGHDLRLARAYGERSEVGLQWVAGREDALTATGRVTSDVRGWSLGGRQALAPAWTLVWNAGQVRQGGLYTRRGLTLGLERRF